MFVTKSKRSKVLSSYPPDLTISPTLSVDLYGFSWQMVMLGMCRASPFPGWTLLVRAEDLISKKMRSFLPVEVEMLVLCFTNLQKSKAGSSLELDKRRAINKSNNWY